MDSDKTNRLRQRLNEIKSSTKIDDSDTKEDIVEEGKENLKKFFLLLFRLTVVYFSQLFIAERIQQPPFTLLQSVVLYFGISAIAVLFKSKQK